MTLTVTATSISSTQVQATFNFNLDYTYAPNLYPPNYSIPGLTISAVYEQSASSVVLNTNTQVGTTYTLTVASAHGTLGEVLSNGTSNFAGTPLTPTISAVATSLTRVRVLFAQDMVNDVNLNNPANYTIHDLAGNAITVTSVTPEQPTNTESVVLVLSTSLHPTLPYQLTVSSLLKTIVSNQSINPPIALFKWLGDVASITLPFSVFSGEVSGGILGSSNGQVFFSPSLNTPTPNSVIQVEEVEVCSIAYDTYLIPQPPDPQLLFTFQKGSPNSVNAISPGGGVLWAPFPRLLDAQFNLSSSDSAPFLTDQMGIVRDSATMVLQPSGNPQQFTVLADSIVASSSIVATPTFVD